jgi:hypothetical protein
MQDATLDRPSAVHRKIMLYCGTLVALLGFADPDGGLIGLPLSFFLKNRLHLQAHEVATFKLCVGLPIYFSFLFGFLRDRWKPWRRGDRGYLMVFGIVMAGLYAGFAFAPVTYAALLIGFLLITIATQILRSALGGLTAVLSREHEMSGPLSAVWNIILTLPFGASLLMGGWLSGLLETRSADVAARSLLLCGAVVTAGIAAFGLLKPASVFSGAEAPAAPASATTPLADLRRLLRHRPIYPALLGTILWQFCPGNGTPLQYYMSNHLHASDAQWSQYNALIYISPIPTYLLFAYLSRTAPLGKLLWVSTMIGVPSLVPLLFVHTPGGALFQAVLFGLMCGLGNAAFFDLLLRACPRGLEGTMMMLGAGVTAVAIRFGDLLGTALYDRWGDFTICVIATSCTTASIFLVLPFVPRSLMKAPDAAAALTAGVLVGSEA